MYYQGYVTVLTHFRDVNRIVFNENVNVTEKDRARETGGLVGGEREIKLAAGQIQG